MVQQSIIVTPTWKYEGKNRAELEFIAVPKLPSPALQERPWLEQQKDNLLKQLFEDNRELRSLEDDILETLSSVQTDILDDQVCACNSRSHEAGSGLDLQIRDLPVRGNGFGCMHIEGVSVSLWTNPISCTGFLGQFDIAVRMVYFVRTDHEHSPI